jgi:hypothetical protein
MFTRVSPLILYLQAAVFLVLVNYYLNPALLRPYCVAGTPSHTQPKSTSLPWGMPISLTAPPV